MKKQFVTYEIALKLKELGFDKPCFGFFDGSRNNKLWYEMPNKGINYIPTYAILAPLWQQVIDWLANTHKIFIEIRFADKTLTVYEFCVYKTFEELVKNTTERIGLGDDRKVYTTYSEVREKAILKAIELCQNKKS